MKIIQVTGRSNSGKTTFIKTLIPQLNKKGRVAVIKHLADHEYILEKGKDTTLFFAAGADISTGIDGDKSVVAIRNNSLDTILKLLKALGMDYVVIEGFKERNFKKIVIGDLQIEGCILRDPAVEDVVSSVDQFDTYN
ncbi:MULTISPECIES: molybdopterin-guanine dinucleotide biosynthesis protein B [unclassified Methanoregula]|uniref:molybdopterin-guanine dinucleotide biosynthesis protein B n=1 Tax=unclassified Methanoregula TaxID=2649730 RepID=UPI0009CC1A46|nr:MULTISPECIES: molybdopterin-guanine dinucleotide biosynthesis protein B [unclassified Methanoregula]OPX61913.1 MAG: molybdopterin-guanine dinucleotide biosynthesis protein B [Methanoregula sp. PtaB.Bin085]OPY34413.1 MAG: molybdopterin-guanine dinucleotide biosynthesis protein B [Methanoregula sp. PtaU1.Bin006]